MGSDIFFIMEAVQKQLESNQATNDLFERSVKSELEESSFNCQSCPFKSKFKVNLKRHTQSIHEGLTFQCKICNLILKTRGSLTRHKKSKSCYNARNLTYNANQTTNKCKFCDYKAKTKGHLKKHTQAIHE